MEDQMKDDSTFIEMELDEKSTTSESDDSSRTRSCCWSLAPYLFTVLLCGLLFVYVFMQLQNLQSGIPVPQSQTGGAPGKFPGSREGSISSNQTWDFHGISSGKIAHLYGEKEYMADYIGKKYTDSRALNEYKLNGNLCDSGRAYVNSAEDIWCPDMMAFYLRNGEKNEGTFDYFREAPWMSSKENQANYKVLNTHKKIQVKTAGMYLIQATIHFYHKVGGTVQIIRQDSDETLHIISRCRTRMEKQLHGKIPDYLSILPCSMTTVVALKADEIVYMDIQDRRYFMVNKTSLYFTVIKLNGELV